MENRNVSEKTKCLVWNRRTLLERYLFLVGLLFFIAFFVMIGVLLHFQNINKKSEICLSHVCKHEAGSILENMDFTIDPCQNFYEFACGSYMQYQDIYSEKIRRSSNLYNYMVYLIKVQLEKPENADDPPFYAKVKNYYKSCMNKPTDINDIIRDLLNVTELDGWPLTENYRSRSTMEDAAALALVYSGSYLLFIVQTEGRPSYLTMSNGHTIVHPNVLLNTTEEESVKEKKLYVGLYNYVFSKLSFSAKDSKKYIDEMIEFETSLAKIQQGKRNDNSTNSTISELESQCPQIKWKNWFKLFFKTIDHPEEYNDEYPLKIQSMEYINDLCNIIGNSDKNKRILYNLLVWNMIVRYLDRFDFIFRQLLGEMSKIAIFEKAIFPTMNTLKWKTCINDLERYFQIGMEYITIKSMDPDEKISEAKSYAKKVSEMLREIFSDQDWLDDFSKNVMKSKLENISYHIGYTNISVDDEFLNQILENIIITDNYMQNMLAVRKQTVIDDIYNQDLLSYFYRELHFPPFSLTASYSDGEQEGNLVISLAFLHSPFYGYGLPNYINYGGIATLIGHEFSHGFHQLEEQENMSEEFLEEYKQRKDCLVNQYFKFPLEGNLTINGNRTIGDNFADNSGLTIALRAYEKYLKHNGEEPHLPGLDFTNKQMFFINYAQLWCEMIESMKEFFEKDVHSPGKYRVIVPLMNSPEFSKAFDCPVNSYMNPEHKCRIWE